MWNEHLYLYNVHCLVQHTLAAEPWRSPRPWTCSPNPEHTSPAVSANRTHKYSSIHSCDRLVEVVLHTVGYIKCNVSLELRSECCHVLTDSPGRGLSWPSMTDILASWSSLLSVCTVLRAESISRGPQASWAFRQHTRVSMFLACIYPS